MPGDADIQESARATTVRIFPLHGLTQEQRTLLYNAQRETAAVYNECCALHRVARQTSSPWPTRFDLYRQTKGTFSHVCAQSVQQTCRAFAATITSTRANRIHGQKQMRYPWREKRFHPIRWPLQALQWTRTGTRFPLGGLGSNRRFVDLPIHLPHHAGGVQVVWRHGQYELHITVTQAAETASPGGERGCIDLGEIYQAALVTSTGKGLLISGRGIRTLKQGRNRAMGRLSKKQAHCTKGSRQWRKLQRAKDRINGRTDRQVRDLRHKGTRLVINAARAEGVGTFFIGNPDGVRRRRSGRHHNQRMSQWEYGKDSAYLRQKGERVGITVMTGQERGTSRTCPHPDCRHRQKVRGRVWKCAQCKGVWRRDFVGATTMFPLAFGTDACVLVPDRRNSTYRRPGPVACGRRSGRRRRPDRGHGGTTIPTVLITSAAGHPPELKAAHVAQGTGLSGRASGTRVRQGTTRATMV